MYRIVIRDQTDDVLLLTLTSREVSLNPPDHRELPAYGELHITLTRPEEIWVFREFRFIERQLYTIQLFHEQNTLFMFTLPSATLAAAIETWCDDTVQMEVTFVYLSPPDLPVPSRIPQEPIDRVDWKKSGF